MEKRIEKINVGQIRLQRFSNKKISRIKKLKWDTNKNSKQSILLSFLKKKLKVNLKN